MTASRTEHRGAPALCLEAATPTHAAGTPLASGEARPHRVLDCSHLLAFATASPVHLPRCAVDGAGRASRLGRHLAEEGAHTATGAEVGFTTTGTLRASLLAQDDHVLGELRELDLWHGGLTEQLYELLRKAGDTAPPGGRLLAGGHLRAVALSPAAVEHAPPHVRGSAPLRHTATMGESGGAQQAVAPAPATPEAAQAALEARQAAARRLAGGLPHADSSAARKACGSLRDALHCSVHTPGNGSCITALHSSLRAKDSSGHFLAAAAREVLAPYIAAAATLPAARWAEDTAAKLACRAPLPPCEALPAAAHFHGGAHRTGEEALADLRLAGSAVTGGVLIGAAAQSPLPAAAAALATLLRAAVQLAHAVHGAAEDAPAHCVGAAELDEPPAACVAFSAAALHLDVATDAADALAALTVLPAGAMSAAVFAAVSEAVAVPGPAVATQALVGLGSLGHTAPNWVGAALALVHLLDEWQAAWVTHSAAVQPQLDAAHSAADALLGGARGEQALQWRAHVRQEAADTAGAVSGQAMAVLLQAKAATGTARPLLTARARALLKWPRRTCHPWGGARWRSSARQHRLLPRHGHGGDGAGVRCGAARRRLGARCRPVTDGLAGESGRHAVPALLTTFALSRAAPVPSASAAPQLGAPAATLVALRRPLAGSPQAAALPAASPAMHGAAQGLHAPLAAGHGQGRAALPVQGSAAQCGPCWGSSARSGTFAAAPQRRPPAAAALRAAPVAAHRATTAQRAGRHPDLWAAAPSPTPALACQTAVQLPQQRRAEPLCTGSGGHLPLVSAAVQRPAGQARRAPAGRVPHWLLRCPPCAQSRAGTAPMHAAAPMRAARAAPSHARAQRGSCLAVAPVAWRTRSAGGPRAAHALPPRAPAAPCRTAARAPPMCAAPGAAGAAAPGRCATHLQPAIEPPAAPSALVLPRAPCPCLGRPAACRAA